MISKQELALTVVQAQVRVPYSLVIGNGGDSSLLHDHLVTCTGVALPFDNKREGTESKNLYFLYFFDFVFDGEEERGKGNNLRHVLVVYSC